MYAIFSFPYPTFPPFPEKRKFQTSSPTPFLIWLFLGGRGEGLGKLCDETHLYPPFPHFPLLSYKT